MALSQHEDFAIWFLRTSYLNNCKDGVGERLININSSILNAPGFKAAGWTVDPVQRTHSPPIPTATATEYFRAPPELQREESRDDEDEEGGMITGRRSNDTVGPSINVKRRRRKEQIEDDDSSDLSDESEEDAEVMQRAAQQIRFAKMPARDRSGSSPTKEDETVPDGPNVMITSPSKPNGRNRAGSLGAVEAVKARARADTTTSSDFSSENEIDPSYFQRRQVNSKKPNKSMLLPEVIRNEEDKPSIQKVADGGGDDSDADSDDSGVSSDLGQTVDTNSLLNTMDDSQLETSSPILPGVGSSQPRIMVGPESPKKTRSTPLLQELPPPRPISVIQPISLLSQALRKDDATTNPLQRYAALSAKASANPLHIKIYAPFSEDADEPYEIALQRTSKDGEPVIVAEVIGLSLWCYSEEDRKPPLSANQLDVNKWILRMIDDGDVEYDFPPLARTRPVTDFTSNNNRGARGRSRGKVFDEFALVEASSSEYEANKRDTPTFSPTKSEIAAPKLTPQEGASPQTLQITTAQPAMRSNPLLAGQPFQSALSNMRLTPADKPVTATTTSTPRMGTMKTVRVRFFDIDMAGHTTKVEMSTDSYLAEILDHVCRRWNLDKAGFLLKVSGTNTVAPLDRTVEALGTRSDLDLVRKRFGAGPETLTGSPGSASPNAPLLLEMQGLAGKKGKKGQKMLHPLASKQQELLQSASNFKKYYVTRRQLTSFTQNSSRVLVFDGDFLHNMPADTGKQVIDSNAKTNSFAFSDILRCKVSSKHSKLIRIVVQRPNEQKRYDFEARSAGEAQEIVDEITKEMRLARGGG